MARIEGMTLARGNRGLLIIALLAGLIAAVLVFAALAQSDDGGSTTDSTLGPTVKTVVAAQDIAAGTTITPEMLRVANNWPEDLKVTGAFDNTTPVVGEVTREAIAEGEALTASKIGPGQDGDGLKYYLAPGMQAFALRIEEGTAVGGNLRPGDRVDVHAVFAANDSTQRSIGVTILQNVEVLALADKRPPEDVKEQPSASTITFAVEPSQAPLLAAVQEEATKVYLSLRSFGDEDAVETAPVDTSTLVPQ